MIARTWHGYTTRDNANAYEELLRTKILPGIHGIAGYRGAHLLRRDLAQETEFITVTMWDSMDSIQQFAGGHASVVPPDAQKLLARYDAEAVHYEHSWVP